MRSCEGCGYKMPAFTPRSRHPETGKLVCPGCHPNKAGSESRPIGLHGSLSCASCSAPMRDAGLVRIAGLLVCADGCKTAAVGYCNLCGQTRELARDVPGQSVCVPCQQRLTGKTAEITPPLGFDDLYNTWLVAVRHPDGSRESLEISAPDARTAADAATQQVGVGSTVGNVVLLRGGLRPADLSLAATRKTAEQVEVEVAGLALQAADTGRILMLQRSYNDKDDPARGCFEFPGGHVEEGESPVAAAIREWTEEVGTGCPQGDITGSWRSPNGIYQGFVMKVESEADVPVNLGEREVANPDDPDGDDIETVVWLRPEDVPDMPALRPECKDTDWTLFEETAMSATARRTAGLQVVAHDSGDGQTVYHCPFCGAGQTVGRSDGTTECGFCKTYFTVQVQPQHAAMPQTDPLTGQPMGMPGMPGDPATHSQPLPSPTQTNAPAGTGDFSPAGTGGPEGFAPAGQGPVEQFAPAGSGSGSRAASRRTAADREPGVELWAKFPGDEQHSRLAFYPRTTADRFAQQLEQYRSDPDNGTDFEARVSGIRYDADAFLGYLRDGGTLTPKDASRKVAWDTDEWDEQHDPQGDDDPCTRCGGDGELEDVECEACEGTGQTPAGRRGASKTAAGQAGQCNYCGADVAAGGLRAHYEVCKEQPLKENRGDNRSRSSDGKFAAMYLTPDQVALPEPSYLAHLALRFAGDKAGVLQQVRRERAAR